MDTKNENKELSELNIITAYAQLVFCTLKNSKTEINNKSIRDEIKMFYEKFGNDGVIKLSNTIVREKKVKC
ncbi:MAG: hypothetical protein HFJ49_05085 [Clostridia bacterium]|nr:hypothetical protein [Clostridia bacterium]